MLKQIIGCGVILIVLLVSGYFYNHRGKMYAKNKIGKINTPEHVKYIYQYLRISCLVVGLFSFLTNYKILLKIHDSDFFFLIGVFLTLSALILFVSAKLTLGEQYSPCFDSYLPNELISTGIYKYIRHPIYTANFFIFFGLFLATGSLWLLANCLIIVWYALISAHAEEKHLREKFPQYKEYMKTTWRFLPGIF